MSHRLRGKEFVTRKITDAAARISLGTMDCLQLGNLDAKRDWGYAKEYVEGMWRMLQADAPDTFVLATNRTESVRDFVSLAFKAVDIQLDWQGSAETERGTDARTGKTLVEVNPRFIAQLKWISSSETRRKPSRCLGGSLKPRLRSFAS